MHRVSNTKTPQSRVHTVVMLDQGGWQRAAVVIVPPPPMLAHVVDFLWIDARPRLSPRGHAWRIVADDAPHVIYSRFTDDRGTTEGHRLHVVGPRPRYVDVDCRHRLVTVGARLRPGAVPALFAVPARELTSQSVPADALVRAQARQALGCLEADGPPAAATHVAAFIAALVARGRPIDARARWLGSVDGRALRTVRDVAHDMGLGERAVRAWSVTHLGLGLRRFLSIRRLHGALERRLSNHEPTWSRVAATAGFADQPHFVRDCHALLGESPSEFFARAG